MIKRLESIDQFRGFAILSMILVNFLAHLDATPSFLRHAGKYGFTFADLVAPFFLFSVGLVSQESLNRAIQRMGSFRGYVRLIKRNVLLIIIGIAGSMLMKLRIEFSWGILQAIGLAGIITLPFTISKPLRKVLLCFFVFTFYSILGVAIPEVIMLGKHGGPQGAFMWAQCILLGEIAASLISRRAINQNIYKLLTYAIILILIGVLASNFILISKPALTPSYIVLSSGLSCLAFVVFFLLSEQFNIKVPTLSEMGRNALLIFILHYLLIKIFRAIISNNFEGALTGCISIILTCAITAVWLHKKKLYLKV